MDKLIISYKHRNDWYVGEIHRYFHKKFSEKYPNIDFEFIENDTFRNRYNIGDYQGSYPSILNQYNFVITNPKNNKTFINSLNDYAPFCLYPTSGVENFDVQKFGFVSNYSNSLLGPIMKYNPTPSFYILENFSDLDRVDRYRKKTRSIDKVFFLGLMYGKRNTYKDILEDSELFEIQSKSKEEFFKDKEGYFNKITDYTMSLSFDGAAKICHRDIENIAIGNLLIRESLDIEMNNPLIPNVHYFELLNTEEKEKLNSNTPEDKKYFKSFIEDRVKSIINDKTKTKNIINEGINWYENNCKPKKQFDLINSFTENLNILF